MLARGKESLLAPHTPFMPSTLLLLALPLALAHGALPPCDSLEGDCMPDANVVLLQTVRSIVTTEHSPSSNLSNGSNATASVNTTGHAAPVNATDLAVAISSVPHELMGSASCPCIGISNLSGEARITVGGVAGAYPAEVGSYCGRWDAGHNPECIGNKAPLMDPAYCLEPWCFVDPCNCKLPGGAVPKVSGLFPQGKMQDHGMYYAYETCGGKDTWTSQANAHACVNAKTAQDCFQKEGCAWTLDRGCLGEELTGSACETAHVTDALVWGLSDCSCVGFSGVEGFVNTSLQQNNATVNFSYPASVGGTCKAWDKDAHPECVGAGKKPDWCAKKWCFVDPCKCLLPTPPKVSALFPQSYWKGHQVYYSYATCGEVDSYTSEQNTGACVLKKDQSSCERESKCAWTVMNEKFVCVGKDLATLCFASEVKTGARGDAARSSGLLALAMALLLRAC